MKTSRALVALAVSFALPALSANAAIVTAFSDDFESEGSAGTSTNNYNTFANWNVDNGSVDLVDDPGNPWGLACQTGSSKCIDLDGSTGTQGTISTIDTFAPGTYSLQFDLSGSQRGDGLNSVDVTFGSLSQTFTLVCCDPWQTFLIPSITVSVGDKLTFAANSATGSDKLGLLLDNVLVVPLPAAFWLFSSGLIGMIGLSRRRKALQA